MRARWLAFVARPRPDVAPPEAGSPAAALAALLALATPLALAAAVAVAPLAQRFGVESRLDFRFGFFEAALVLTIAPSLKELVFRWPLKSRRTFERGVVLLPLAGLALLAIARAAAAPSDTWVRLAAIAAAATAAALALLAIDDALERHRFTAVDGARTLFTRHYPAIAHGLTLAFALTHAPNYEFTAANIALVPLLVLPQWIVGSACLYARLAYGLPAAIALHLAHNVVSYGLVAAALYWGAARV
ncbi:MAG: hypothetical protein OHK0044_01860 [Burkholderiaceae bacterium]